MEPGAAAGEGSPVTDLSRADGTGGGSIGSRRCVPTLLGGRKDHGHRIFVDQFKARVQPQEGRERGLAPRNHNVRGCEIGIRLPAPAPRPDPVKALEATAAGTGAQPNNSTRHTSRPISRKAARPEATRTRETWDCNRSVGATSEFVSRLRAGNCTNSIALHPRSLLIKVAVKKVPTSRPEQPGAVGPRSAAGARRANGTPRR